MICKYLFEEMWGDLIVSGMAPYWKETALKDRVGVWQFQ